MANLAQTFEQIPIKTLMGRMTTQEKKHKITFLTKKKLYEVNKESTKTKEFKEPQNSTKYIGKEEKKSRTYKSVSNIIENYLTGENKTKYGIIGKGSFKLAIKKMNTLNSNSYYLIEFFEYNGNAEIPQINTYISKYKKKIERIRNTLIGGQRNTTEISLPETLYYCVFVVNNYTYIALINKTKKLKEVIPVNTSTIDENITLKQFTGLLKSLRNAHERSCVIGDIKLVNTMWDDKKLYFIDMDDIHIYKDFVNETKDIIPKSIVHQGVKIPITHSSNNKIFLKKITPFAIIIKKKVEEIDSTIKYLDGKNKDTQFYKDRRNDFIKLHSNIFKLCDWCGLLYDIICYRNCNADKYIKNFDQMEFESLKNYLFKVNIVEDQNTQTVINNYNNKEKNWTIDLSPTPDGVNSSFTHSIFYNYTVNSILLYAMRFMEIFDLNLLNLYKTNTYIEYYIKNQLYEIIEDNYGEVTEFKIDDNFCPGEEINPLLKDLNVRLEKNPNDKEIKTLVTRIIDSLKQKNDILEFTSDTLTTLSLWIECNYHNENVTLGQCSKHLNNDYIDFYLKNTIQKPYKCSEGLKKTLISVNYEKLIIDIKNPNTLTNDQREKIKYIVAANNINCCNYTNDEWMDWLFKSEYTSQNIFIYEFQLRVLQKLAHENDELKCDIEVLTEYKQLGKSMIVKKKLIHKQKLSNNVTNVIKELYNQIQTIPITDFKNIIYNSYKDYYISDDIQRWFNQQQKNQQQNFNESFIEELDRLRNVSSVNFMNYVKARLKSSGAMYNQYVYDIEC